MARPRVFLAVKFSSRTFAVRHVFRWRVRAVGTGTVVRQRFRFTYVSTRFVSSPAVRIYGEETSDVSDSPSSKRKFFRLNFGKCLQISKKKSLGITRHDCIILTTRLEETPWFSLSFYDFDYLS